MAHVDAAVSPYTHPSEASRADNEAELSRHAHEVYRLLHVGFVVAPIVVGLDTFLHLLTSGDTYRAKRISNV